MTCCFIRSGQPGLFVFRVIDIELIAVYRGERTTEEASRTC
ncbi:hypothetical protein [Paenibacillus contaminans]|nr:hypothetical protein [Paenibacillus contaminans]